MRAAGDPAPRRASRAVGIVLGGLWWPISRAAHLWHAEPMTADPTPPAVERRAPALRLPRRLRGAARRRPADRGRARRSRWSGRTARASRPCCCTSTASTDRAHGAGRASAGSRLTARHLRRIRADVGLVFQDPDDQLFSPTVLRRRRLRPAPHGHATPMRSTARVEHALEAVGMAGFERRLPSHLSIGAAQARGAGDRAVDGSVGPRLRRAVRRARPARPPPADRAAAGAAADGDRRHPRHAPGAEVLPRTVVMDGGRSSPTARPRTSSTMRPSSRRTAWSVPRVAGQASGRGPRRHIVQTALERSFRRCLDGRSATFTPEVGRVAQLLLVSERLDAQSRPESRLRRIPGDTWPAARPPPRPTGQRVPRPVR